MEEEKVNAFLTLSMLVFFGISDFTYCFRLLLFYRRLNIQILLKGKYSLFWLYIPLNMIADTLFIFIFNVNLIKHLPFSMSMGLPVGFGGDNNLI